MSEEQVLPQRAYRHHSGRVYTVICVTNENADDPVKFPVTAVYYDAQGRTWSRPAEVFLQKMTLMTEDETTQWALARLRQCASEALGVEEVPDAR